MRETAPPTSKGNKCVDLWAKGGSASSEPLFCISYFRTLGVFLTQDFVTLILFN